MFYAKYLGFNIIISSYKFESDNDRMFRGPRTLNSIQIFINGKHNTILYGTKKEDSVHIVRGYKSKT